MHTWLAITACHCLYVNIGIKHHTGVFPEDLLSWECHREVMGLFHVRDSEFSLSHARVMLINSPFTRKNCFINVRNMLRMSLKLVPLFLLFKKARIISATCTINHWLPFGRKQNIPLTGISRYLRKFIRATLESWASFLYNHPNCQKRVAGRCAFLFLFVRQRA